MMLLHQKAGITLELKDLYGFDHTKARFFDVNHPRNGPVCEWEKTPRAGFEPATNRLTVDRSTAELPRNGTARTYLPAALPGNP